jgi:hypothetical protein
VEIGTWRVVREGAQVHFEEVAVQSDRKRSREPEADQQQPASKRSKMDDNNNEMERRDESHVGGHVEAGQEEWVQVDDDPIHSIDQTHNSNLNSIETDDYIGQMYPYHARSRIMPDDLHCAHLNATYFNYYYYCLGFYYQYIRIREATRFDLGEPCSRMGS